MLATRIEPGFPGTCFQEEMKNKSQRTRTHHHHSAEFRLPDHPITPDLQTPGLTVRLSRLHGLGCFATRPFPKGRKIAEYTGRRVRFDHLSDKEAPNELNYIIGIDDLWAIDGSQGGNETRYVNHSCESNLLMRVTSGHLIFYARRDVLAGEELTWAYFITYDDGSTDPCPCELKKLTSSASE